MHVGVGEVLIGSLFFIYYFIEKARGTPKLTLEGEDQAARKPKRNQKPGRGRHGHGLHITAALDCTET